MGKTVNARLAALEMLMHCRRDGAWSGAVIDEGLSRYALSGRDAALASRLCLGVLQNDRLCDYYIGCFCEARLEPVVRDILRLGVYQLLFLDRIPARAAVGETVELCAAKGLRRASGLVNAVLRRVAENRDALPEIPGEGSADYLSVRWSHPKWLCAYLIEKKGYAFTEAFLKENNDPPKLCLQVNTLKGTTEDYTRALSEAEIPHRALTPDGCVELAGGLASRLPGYEEGLFYIQDRAARLTVEIAAPEAGMRVLDACACPGGKSFAAAIRMKNRGGILSCDIHAKKLRILTEGAARLGLTCIETRAMDAREYDPALSEGFDLVIADAPCSGFGVIAKKPEIRHKDRESLQSLPVIQGAILDNLSRYVKPGGTLLYSTCTIFEEENENVARAFLEKHADYRAEDFSLCGIESRDGMYTFWPHIDGTDGFFAAKFRRIG
ncbi:MAG: 16S rRNA (cytosine(967)-C(5))-methyltransferase RsmB [Oscillospiraceae bacterium]|nr:16S rRNA (cytosine(967)-C(5))-methyltransferase RsmB [Oscillospiraceae bacterium]